LQEAPGKKLGVLQLEKVRRAPKEMLHFAIASTLLKSCQDSRQLQAVGQRNLLSLLLARGKDCCRDYAVPIA